MFPNNGVNFICAAVLNFDFSAVDDKDETEAAQQRLITDQSVVFLKH